MHRVALIGYGLAGKVFHAPLISAADGLELAAVVTSRHAEVATDYPSAQVLPTFEHALSDPSINLVVLASPDHLHAAQALAALDAGKHVVIDKPFAPTLSEARAVAAKASSKQLMLSIFHNRRWDSDFLTLRRVLEKGELGEVVEFESRFDRYRPEVGERWKDKRVGGVWQDIGPHLIDQALQLFGRPIAISADLAILKAGGHAHDYCLATLRYPGLRVVLHIAQMVPDHSLRFMAHGRCGSFIKRGLDPQEDQSKSGMRPTNAAWGVDSFPGNLIRSDGTVSLVQSARGDYGAYYRAIALALSGEGEVPVSVAEALEVMEVLAAGSLSSEQRREISL